MNITLSAEEIALLGVMIASFLEVIKLIPGMIKRFYGKDFNEEFKKSLPAIAIILGVIINYLIVAPTEVVAKDVLFQGVVIGLAAVGGREAVVSTTKLGLKKDKD